MSVKTYTVRYNVEGVHEQVMKTKSLIYALNAVRLSIKDIDMMMRGPTIQNIMWTAIQLTRTYTHIRRIIRIISKEQDALLAKAVAMKVAQATPGHAIIVSRPGLAAAAPLLGTVAGLAAAHPVGALVVGGVVIGGAMYAGYYWQQEQAKKAYLEQQRQIAKSQGLTP